MSYAFHFLDDVATADLAFEASGKSLQELFQGATCAAIEALTDPTTVGSTWRQTIERTDADPAELLFDWLSELVYWKDAAGVVFSRSELTLTRQGRGCWKVMGLLYGERVNGSAQTLRADVKGVTKHLYRLLQKGEQWTVRVVLDV
ncbi:MAG: archease [Nitrospira sp. LK70]|nr:archease [Nitrospira sp. LK70]